MIRHIVLVRFAEGVTDAGKQEIYDALGALRGHLPGVLDFHHGPNVSVEGPMTKGYQDGFWFDFTDAEARNTYLDDPGHKAAVQPWVLGDFSKAEREWLGPLLDAIADNADRIAAGDAANFMNRVALATPGRDD